MTINRLTATFGKLDHETIEFHEGLNVISAPNESGKSTWCAFIMAMLYGMNTAERPHGGTIPGKIRYQPWNGKAMCGVMEVTSHGKNITLMRSTSVHTAPMKDFTAFYTGSGEKVDGLNPSDAGEMLTGLSSGMFVRSAYIAQGMTAIPCDAETEKQVLMALSSGERGISYTEVDARLVSWQKKRMHGSAGLIAEKVNAAEGINRKLSAIKALSSDLKVAEESFLNKKQRIGELKKKAYMLKKQAQKNMHRRLAEANADVIREKENCIAASERVKNTALEIKKRRMLIASAAAAIAVLLLAVFIAVFRSLFLLVMICAMLSVFLYALLKKDAFSEKLTAAVKTDHLEKQRAEAACINAQNQLRLLEAALANGKIPVKYAQKMAALKKEIILLKKQLETLGQEIAVLNARLEMAGNVSSLESRMKALTLETDELNEEYQALEIARSVLAAADQGIQNSVSPLLSRKTTEYMSFLTDGRYDRVLLDRDLSALTATDGDTVLHKSAFLSAGTRDLLFIAVRLAICSLVPGPSEEAESCPLIIDDALVNLDADRYRRVMALLEKISMERQVLLFTCRE